MGNLLKAIGIIALIAAAYFTGYYTSNSTESAIKFIKEQNIIKE